MPKIIQIISITDNSRVTVIYGLDDQGQVWRTTNQIQNPQWGLYIPALPTK